jgi:hypothetical protein
MMQGVAWPSMTVFQQHPLKKKKKGKKRKPRWEDNHFMNSLY